MTPDLSDNPEAGETLFQAFLDFSGGLFVRLSPQGEIRLINRTGATLLGRHDLQGLHWFSTCVLEADRALMEGFFQQILGGESIESFESSVRTVEGDERNMLWRNAVLFDPQGQVDSVLLFGEDCTEQHRVKDVLDGYRYALDVSSIVALTNTKGRITYVNEQFCEISKYERKELLGQDHRIINSGHHPKSFFKELWDTIRRGEVWRGDICNRAKDGSLYWVETTIVPVANSDGTVMQYMAVRNEITARKNAEAALERAIEDLRLASARERERANAVEVARDELAEANAQLREEQTKLIQAEKLSSIGVLASGVAHEINNPLSGVMACVKALKEGRVKGDRVDEYFATAQDGLERILITTRALLDYARHSPPVQERVAAQDVISGALKLIHPAIRKKNIELKIEADPQANFRVDRRQIMQVLINLVINATHASQPGGHIRIGTIRREVEKGPQLGIQVEDHGSGMSQETIRRACDPFFTTKPEGEGTGLGLAVTLRIIGSHGGDLDIQSEVGSGTKMTVWLPEPGDKT